MKTEETSVLKAVAGDQHQRAELAQRAGEGEGDAGDDAGQQVGEDDAAEDREAAGAERGRRRLHLAVHLDQQRLHGADDEGQGDEEQGHDDAPSRVKAMSMPNGLSLP